MREDGKRKNAVLLNFLRDTRVREYLKQNYVRGLFTINNMQKLRNFCDDEIMYTARGEGRIVVGDKYWRCETYMYDGQRGICEDRDYRAYRYKNLNDGRIYKKKYGRLFRHIIECSDFGRILPESVVLWLCEEHQREWETFARAMLPSDLRLVVDDDFEKIYNGDACKGDFGSCMTSRNHHSFYEDAVKAKAAYLLNNEDKIVSRCVIFTDVKDEDDPNVSLRLAERQYATDGSEILKRDLVRALIDGGHIDGFKRVGASCHDPRAWVGVKGDEDWSGRKFYIECNLDNEDTLSYQDTFKFYNWDEHKAYNYSKRGAIYDLASTNDRFYGEDECENYDEYHDEYTNDEVISVYYNGSWINCNENRLDDFYYVEGEGYVHYEDSFECEHCGEREMNRHAYYSDITGEDYCCESCRNDAEQEYKERHWHYSEYDEEYYQDEDDVTTYINERGDTVSISVDSADDLVSGGELVCINGKYYNTEWAANILEENA